MNTYKIFGEFSYILMKIYLIKMIVKMLNSYMHDKIIFL